MVDRGGPGADRDHRGRPGRHDRVRRLRQGERRPDLQGRDRVLPQPGHLRQHRRRAGHRPRPGNATANCATDNIALLDLAVSRLPGRWRHRLLVGLDGAGFFHQLLAHIAAGGGKRGRHWEFSVGWSCTETELEAIEQLPAQAWTAGIDQDGDVLADTFVAELTGLLDLGCWQSQIPGLRILVRSERCTRATASAPPTGRSASAAASQLIATDTKGGQIAWLDARHRSHVHVEGDVKQAKDLGLNRWPSRSWAINVAWTQIVALAANLLACFRQLALPDGPLRDAAPKLLRYRLFHLPARLTHGQRKRWLHLRADWPGTEEVISAWKAVKALAAPT